MLNEKEHIPGTAELEAIRFVSGEMTADEQARFEHRLEKEPSLAFVLSEVIELESVIESGYSTTAAVHPRRQQTDSNVGERRSTVPVLLAIAACVVVAMLVGPNAIPPHSVEVAATNNPIETENPPAEFVDQWLNAITETNLNVPDEEPIEVAMLDPIDVLESGSGELVPDWMYVAFEDEQTTGVTVE